MDELNEQISLKLNLLDQQREQKSDDSAYDLDKILITIERNMLDAQSKDDTVLNSFTLSENDRSIHTILIGRLRSLQAVRRIDLTPATPIVHWFLTPEGQEYKVNGSIEYRQQSLVKDKIKVDEQIKIFGQSRTRLGISMCQKMGWLKYEDNGTTVIRKISLESIDDTIQKNLLNIENINKEKNIIINQDIYQQQKKRKQIDSIQINSQNISRGENFYNNYNTIEQQRDLDQDTLRSGRWKNSEWKEYNFTVEGKQHSHGSLHPQQKVSQEFHKIQQSMGFEEMDTMGYVESSFWNFDSLFQPQQHPARDSHDTFFLKEPNITDINRLIKDKYIQYVRSFHEVGGIKDNNLDDINSIGYRYPWDINESKKNIQRTHTTSRSARTLYTLANIYKYNKDCIPRKFYSIDRVFRNETVDATHLAEFQQVEGFIIDKNLTLSHLITTIRTFFHLIGIDDIKQKPAYNPYTEPSMEIFGYSKDQKRWIEVGNSGMFRPEMLIPMGFPSDVRVIAWGLSQERPTMIKYNISNIRDLVGPRMQLQLISDNPILKHYGYYILYRDDDNDNIDDTKKIFIAYTLQEAKDIRNSLNPSPILCTYYSSISDIKETFNKYINC